MALHLKVTTNLCMITTKASRNLVYLWTGMAKSYVERDLTFILENNFD